MTTLQDPRDVHERLLAHAVEVTRAAHEAVGGVLDDHVRHGR